MKNKDKESNKKAENAEWLVSTARSHELNGDICTAKSWLLTAKSLFPRDFNIQYEEFLMERKAGKLQRCAKLFYDMIHIFPKEKTLWEELARIFHSQDGTRLQNSDSIFLKEMFDSLAPSHQKELLLKYANHHTDLIDKCRISLLVLKRFKGAVKDQAVKLICTLKAAEDKECPSTPLNIYRRMIVCDILPLILKSSETQIVQQITKHKGGILVNEEQMVQYLNLTLEFYLACVISKYAFTTTTTNGATASSELKILDIDEATSSWNIIHEHIVLFANKLNWSNMLKIKDKVDPSKNRPLRSRWKTLNNAAKDSKPLLGIFYPLLHLHLLTVVEYCSPLLSAEKKGSSETAEKEFLLLENINLVNREVTTPSVIRTPKKKRKTEESGGYSSDYQSSSEDITVVVHPGLLGKVSETLGEHLQVAIDTFNLLNTNFQEEYETIVMEWNIDSWEWMETFHIDSLMFQGKHRKVLQKLSANTLISTKQNLQQCCSLYCSGQRKAACEEGLNMIASLPANCFNTSSTKERLNCPKPDGRSLIVVSDSPQDVLSYVVNILFATLKNGLYSEGTHRDMVIGHLIVLSQLDWSRNEEFFLHLLKLIQAQDDGFAYELLLSYVIQIDILEEFAYLHNTDSVNLLLHSSTDNQSKRTVTRGVNKEAQGGFKAALMRQVQRSHEPVCKVIFDFLRDEGQTILQVL